MKSPAIGIFPADTPVPVFTRTLNIDSSEHDLILQVAHYDHLNCGFSTQGSGAVFGVAVWDRLSGVLFSAHQGNGHDKNQFFRSTLGSPQRVSYEPKKASTPQYIDSYSQIHNTNDSEETDEVREIKEENERTKGQLRI